jgi:uncharacterized protein (TIGR03790 family)
MRTLSAFALVALVALAAPVAALEPKDVWLVVNKNVPASREVADHYIAKRGVPKGNVVELDLPKVEDVSRMEYDAKLAAPLRAALEPHKDAAKVLVTTYGVPLRVGRVLPNADEQKELATLRPELAEARKKLAELEKKDKDKQADAKELAAARTEVNKLQARERVLTHAESEASVDSELMCLWWPDYALVRWQLNPRFRFAPDAAKRNPAVLLVSRLDGPTPDLAKRLVDDAVATEKDGLKGRAVIDARGFKFDAKGKDGGTGYNGYDESMREAAAHLKAAGLEVELDDKPDVLKPGAAKGVALYCGWYSHANFVDCCAYERGAVAWHLASSEAVTLRNADSKVWCPNLLKKGVCATVGPVAEPYTVGFPKPAEFFGLLACGDRTLVECYADSMLFCSWMTVLVGDPLYTPFKGRGKLKAGDIVASPKGARGP